jgi:hypothetical protein
MKAKKEKEDETSDAFSSLKVPIEHEDKYSKTNTVKVKMYDSGIPEEFLKWRLILAEQVKDNGYTDNPDNIMNLAQAMLAGRSLEAFLNENAHKKQRTGSERPRPKRNTHPNKFMTSPYLSCQFERLTSKVDEEMPTRGRESTRGETSSLKNSILKNSVKDCKT